jgi:hypothetical protein
MRNPQTPASLRFGIGLRGVDGRFGMEAWERERSAAAKTAINER